MSSTRKKWWRFGLWLAKGVIVISTGLLFYKSIFEDGLTSDWFVRLWTAFQNGSGGLIAGALCLVPLNWGLEAWKWQELSRKIEKTSWLHAYKGVLVGMTLGFITPNRLGDYAGRILELHSRQRLEAIGAVFLGRFCQLVWTMVAGSFGLLYFYLLAWDQPFPGLAWGIGLSLLLMDAALVLALIYPGMLLAILGSIPLLRRFLPYLNIITCYTWSEIIRVMAMAGLRYGVFIAQFMLLLYAFGITVSPVAMALGVACTFLLKSIVPSFTAFTDLGMRELSAMYIFNLLHQDQALVMSASLSLWLLNIALPSLTGLVFVWGIRLRDIRPGKNK